MMTKQVAAVNALGVFPLILYDDWRAKSKPSKMLAHCAAFALGLTAVPLLVFCLFWLKGAGRDFFYWTLTHNLEYAGGGFADYAAEKLRVHFKRMAPGDFAFWLFAAYGLYECLRRPSRGHALVGGWLATSAMAVCVGWHLRSHYFIQLHPSLALWAGFGMWRAAVAAGRLVTPSQRALAYAGISAVAIAPPLCANLKYFCRLTSDQISRTIYGQNPFVEAERIADHLQRHTPPNGTVFILGSEPEILFHARRRSATKYIIFYPLTGPYRDVKEKQLGVADELARNKPEFIVLVNLQTSLLRRRATESFIFDKVLKLVWDDYRLDGFANIKADAARLVFDPEEVKADEDAVRKSLPEVSIFRRRPG
jgi:hypothetical protein